MPAVFLYNSGMDEKWARMDETTDDLQCSGFQIIQGKHDFRFSMDPVLLANFCSGRAGDRAADFCAGSGIIGLLLLAHGKCHSVKAIEIQPQLCDRMERSIKMNGVSESMKVIEGDVRNAAQILGFGTMDHVVCNPPYLPAERAKPGMRQDIALSRYELMLTLRDVCESASKVLRNGGRLTICHRADRAAEVLMHCMSAGLSPKRARLVQPESGKPATLILVEAQKQAKPGLKWLPVLNVYEDGRYTDEIYDIYGMKKEQA